MPDSPATASALPVTVVISRRPAPGREAELLEWAHGIRDAASRFPGHLGAEIYPPKAPDCDDLVLAFSFANAEALTAWEHSDERQSWLDRGASLLEGEVRTHAVSGFEGIFAPAPGGGVVPPPRWKTAAIIAMALYPVSLLLNWLLGPHLAPLNIFVRVLINVAIIVPYMAWVGVPYLTRWLRNWLHPVTAPLTRVSGAHFGRETRVRGATTGLGWRRDGSQRGRRTRMRPSCTVVATSVPSSLKIRPRPSPRPPEATGDSWSCSSHSSVRTGRWNHIA